MHKAKSTTITNLIVTMIVILVIMMDLIIKENIMKRKKYLDNKFDNDDW